MPLALLLPVRYVDSIDDGLRPDPTVQRHDLHSLDCRSTSDADEQEARDVVGTRLSGAGDKPDPREQPGSYKVGCEVPNRRYTESPKRRELPAIASVANSPLLDWLPKDSDTSPVPQVGSNKLRERVGNDPIPMR
jgi:hypothetical protein